MKKILFFSLLVSNFLLDAQLLVVQINEKGHVEPISNDMIQKHKNDILEVLLNYTWPACIGSDLTDEEKQELLAPQENAELNFVRKKLKQISKELDVIFVPTALYELFYIEFYLNLRKYICEKSFLEKLQEKSYLMDHEYIESKVSNSLEEIEDILKLDETSLKEEMQEANKNISLAEFVKEKINELSLNCNAKLFEEEDVYGYPNLLLVHQLFVYSYLYSENTVRSLTDIKNLLYKNSEEIKYSIIGHLIKLQQDVANDSDIQEKYPIFYDWMTNNKKNSDNEPNPLYSERYGLLQILDFLKKEEENHIIQKVIELEYQAAKSNKGLLFRGSDKISIKNYSKGIIGTTQIIKDEISIEDQGLFSMSFGNSLFAGAFFYIDAMSYAYLSELGGYALFIDKFQYVDNYNSNLFLISGLSTEMGLFGAGVWFHSRSKPVTLDKLKHNKPIVGIVTDYPYEEIIKDPAGIFLVTRDPYRQAYLFSKYLVENGKIIGKIDTKTLIEDEQIALDMLENQKKYTARNFFELWAKKYKQRKKRKTKEISKQQSKFQQQVITNTLDLARAVTMQIKEKVHRGLSNRKNINNKETVARGLDLAYSINKSM